MNKLIILVTACALLPGLAVASTAKIASSPTPSQQNITPTSSAAVQFSPFQITLSKDVSLYIDDTTGLAANQVSVSSKHKASTHGYSGNTSGGSVKECGTALTPNTDIAAVCS